MTKTSMNTSEVANSLSGDAYTDDYTAQDNTSHHTGPSETSNGIISQGILSEGILSDSGNREETDSEGEDEFIKKYGDVNFTYIKRPAPNPWFTKPHALNYFKDGVLYRTKGERSSSKTELFLDLLYVGIIANLAGEAVENAGWGAFLKYILLFMAVWTVWCDVKDFTNYYYNEDLSQKLYILWVLCLLTLMCNNTGDVLEGRSGAAYVIVPYMLCRYSVAISLLLYTFWIPEHRVQQRIYSGSIFFTSSLWIIVIFVGTRAKIGLAFVIFFIEHFSFLICFHPWIKKKLSLTTSTALSIEHEVERVATFVTIAIGEFLYKIVASRDLGTKFQSHFWRGILLLVDAYILFWIYNYGSMAVKATHGLRHSGVRALTWIDAHLPLIAAIVLAADAGGDLCQIDDTVEETLAKRFLVARAEEEEHENVQAIKFFFTGGLFVALMALGVLGFNDDPKDPKGIHYVLRFWRVIFRFPIGVVILVLPFADVGITKLMGLVTLLLGVLVVWETGVGTPICPS